MIGHMWSAGAETTAHFLSTDSEISSTYNLLAAERFERKVCWSANIMQSNIAICVTLFIECRNSSIHLPRRETASRMQLPSVFKLKGLNRMIK